MEKTTGTLGWPAVSGIYSEDATPAVSVAKYRSF
jgi:hypothetical protein